MTTPWSQFPKTAPEQTQDQTTRSRNTNESKTRL